MQSSCPSCERRLETPDQDVAGAFGFLHYSHAFHFVLATRTMIRFQVMGGHAAVESPGDGSRLAKANQSPLLLATPRSSAARWCHAGRETRGKVIRGVGEWLSTWSKKVRRNHSLFCLWTS